MSLRVRAATSGGRLPSFTGAARAVVALSGALILGGALANLPRLTALGLLLLAGLSVLYVRFFARASALWRQRVSLEWELAKSPEPLRAGVPFSVEARLRSSSTRDLGQLALAVIASPAVHAPRRPPLAVPAASRVEFRVELTAATAGRWRIHGLRTELFDALGLWSVEAYFPQPLPLLVLPRAVARNRRSPRPPGAHSDQAGPARLRRRGEAGELRELRPHVPGDPYRRIAWKASARRGQLMVREVDHETLTTLHLIVDIGASVRWGQPRPLDRLLDDAAAAALDGLTRGDRVALTLFDHRIVDDIADGRGPLQRRAILEALVDAAHPVDEDLTAISDSELAERLAELARLHRGRETMVRDLPPLEDARWQHLMATPRGQLIDVAQLDGLLAPEVPAITTGKLPRAASVDGARLRHYCRYAGVPLPPRADVRPERGDALAAALTHSAQERGHRRILVLSDFEGLGPGRPALVRALRLVRRRGHRLTLWAPPLPPDLEGADTLPEMIDELDRWQRRARRTSAQRDLWRLGLGLEAGAVADAPTTRSVGNAADFGLTAPRE